MVDVLEGHIGAKDPDGDAPKQKQPRLNGSMGEVSYVDKSRSSRSRV